MQPNSGLIIHPGTPHRANASGCAGTLARHGFSLVAEVLGEEGKALAAAHAGAEHSHDLTGGWERYGEVLAVINHLGLDPDADFTALSGGTKRRVALARALICSEDLILDEPTNHLDIATITWLEDFLLRKARTLIFVSHDRAFAKRLATRVVEVDRGKLHNYSCEIRPLSRTARGAPCRRARLCAARQKAVFGGGLRKEECLTVFPCLMKLSGGFSPKTVLIVFTGIPASLRIKHLIKYRC